MAARFLSFVIRHCFLIVNPKIVNRQLLFPHSRFSFAAPFGINRLQSTEPSSA